jgi:hypothetical protein
MKRRTLLVPLYQLDKPQSVQFMELIAEASYQQGNSFAQLGGLGLDSAIQMATSALQRFKKPHSHTALYWTNPSSNLLAVDGVTLALVLGAWAMEQPAGYERIIVSGRLTAQNDIVSNGYFSQSCAAVLALQAVSSATCFIVPISAIESHEQQIWLNRLRTQGVDVYPVATLDQAVRVCFSSVLRASL